MNDIPKSIFKIDWWKTEFLYCPYCESEKNIRFPFKNFKTTQNEVIPEKYINPIKEKAELHDKYGLTFLNDLTRNLKDLFEYVNSDWKNLWKWPEKYFDIFMLIAYLILFSLIVFILKKFLYNSFKFLKQRVRNVWEKKRFFSFNSEKSNSSPEKYDEKLLTADKIKDTGEPYSQKISKENIANEELFEIHRKKLKEPIVDTEEPYNEEIPTKEKIADEKSHNEQLFDIHMKELKGPIVDTEEPYSRQEMPSNEKITNEKNHNEQTFEKPLKELDDSDNNDKISENRCSNNDKDLEVENEIVEPKKVIFSNQEQELKSSPEDLNAYSPDKQSFNESDLDESKLQNEINEKLEEINKIKSKIPKSNEKYCKNYYELCKSQNYHNSKRIHCINNTETKHPCASVKSELLTSCNTQRKHINIRQCDVQSHKYCNQRICDSYKNIETQINTIDCCKRQNNIFNKGKILANPIKKDNNNNHEIQKQNHFKPDDSSSTPTDDTSIISSTGSESVDFQTKDSSPIDIQTKMCTPVYFKNPITWNCYKKKPLAMKITNSDRTVVITGTWHHNEIPTLSGGPLVDDAYTFDKLLFKWGTSNGEGSEHAIDSKYFSLEKQLIFKRCPVSSKLSKNQTEPNQNKHVDTKSILDYVVVSSFYDVFQNDPNTRNACLDKILKYVDQVQENGSWCPITETFSLFSTQEVINSNYFAYFGSTTSPPLKENALWIILPEISFVSKGQMHKLRNIKSDNGKKVFSNRLNIQPLNKKRSIFLCSSTRFVHRHFPFLSF